MLLGRSGLGLHPLLPHINLEILAAQINEAHGPGSGQVACQARVIPQFS